MTEPEPEGRKEGRNDVWKLCASSAPAGASSDVQQAALQQPGSSLLQPRDEQLGLGTEAALLLHCSHHHGHPVQPLQEDDLGRDLLLDHGHLPVLLHQQAGLAELNTPQSLSQRVFHQGKPAEAVSQLKSEFFSKVTKRQEQTWQGILLDHQTECDGDVRERKL